MTFILSGQTAAIPLMVRYQYLSDTVLQYPAVFTNDLYTWVHPISKSVYVGIFAPWVKQASGEITKQPPGFFLSGFSPLNSTQVGRANLTLKIEADQLGDGVYGVALIPRDYFGQTFAPPTSSSPSTATIGKDKGVVTDSVYQQFFVDNISVAKKPLFAFETVMTVTSLKNNATASSLKILFTKPIPIIPELEAIVTCPCLPAPEGDTTALGSLIVQGSTYTGVALSSRVVNGVVNTTYPINLTLRTKTAIPYYTTDMLKKTEVVTWYTDTPIGSIKVTQGDPQYVTFSPGLILEYVKGVDRSLNPNLLEYGNELGNPTQVLRVGELRGEVSFGVVRKSTPVTLKSESFALGWSDGVDFKPLAGGNSLAGGVITPTTSFIEGNSYPTTKWTIPFGSGTNGAPNPLNYVESLVQGDAPVSTKDLCLQYTAIDIYGTTSSILFGGVFAAYNNKPGYVVSELPRMTDSAAYNQHNKGMWKLKNIDPASTFTAKGSLTSSTPTPTTTPIYQYIGDELVIHVAPWPLRHYGIHIVMGLTDDEMLGRVMSPQTFPSKCRSNIKAQFFGNNILLGESAMGTSWVFGRLKNNLPVIAGMALKYKLTTADTPQLTLSVAFVNDVGTTTQRYYLDTLFVKQRTYYGSGGFGGTSTRGGDGGGVISSSTTSGGSLSGGSYRY